MTPVVSRTCLLFLLVVSLRATATAAAAAAGDIPDVRTLDELKSLAPFDAAGGWKVRLGLSDGGPSAGPVWMLYCIAEQTARPATAPSTPSTKPPASNIPGEQIGPLWYDVEWSGHRIRQLRRQITFMERAGPSLFAASMPLYAGGRGRVVVRDVAGKLLAARTIVVDVRRPAVWHEFARRERARGPFGFVVADDPMLSIMRMVGSAPRGLPGAGDATTKPSTRPAPLPFDLGTEPDPRRSLSIALEGATFIVKSSTDMPFTNDADRHLLARWWLNDKPVAAERIAKQHAMQRTGQVLRTDTLHVGFCLPDILGDARVGDRVGVQLLYAPDGFEPAPTGQAMILQQQQLVQMHAKDAWPVLSNRIEFALTEALLTVQDHPRETPANER